MMKDLVSEQYSIDQVVQFYEIPGANVLAPRMTATAFVATQLAKIQFDSSNKKHLMLNDMRLKNDIKAVTEKYKISRSDLILNLAQLAYEAVDVAMNAGIVSMPFYSQV